MALINCPDCGKPISQESAFCVHCGFTSNAQYSLKSISNSLETIKTIIIIYFILTIIGAVIFTGALGQLTK